MKEEVARIQFDLNKPEDRKLLNEAFSGVHNTLNHPPERKIIDIRGDTKAGKETLQQIAREIADEHQNFRFFPQKEEQQTKENTIKSQPAVNQTNNESSAKAIILSIFLISSFILVGCLFWREREREGKEKAQNKN